MNSYDELKVLVAEKVADEKLAEKVAEHCATLCTKEVFGYISPKIVDKYLKSRLEVGPGEISYYLGEISSPIVLMPNNGIEEVAEDLEPFHFTTLELLTCASNYVENNDVLWVNTARRQFGTIDGDAVVDLYIDDFAEWVLENKYEGFFGVGLDGDDDSDALVWIMNNKSKVVRIVNQFLGND